MKSVRGVLSVLGAAGLVAACNTPPQAEDVGGAGGQTSAGGSVATGGSAGTAGSTVVGGAAGSAAAGGVAGGGAATGGTAGTDTGTAGTGGTAPSGTFELLWEDQFDTFDGARWSKRDHTFPENSGVFAPENVVVEGGMLKLKVTNVPNGDKAYSAAEVRTNETFMYGRFEARIKPAGGSGMVSSLFTYLYDPWNEIDFEYLGNQPEAVQWNVITRPPGGGDLTYQPLFDRVFYPPWQSFHDYAFEWTPTEVRYYVDGELRGVETENISRLSNPVHLHMNCWPVNHNATNFAGALDTSAIPAESQYEWVRAYKYVP